MKKVIVVVGIVAVVAAIFWGRGSAPSLTEEQRQTVDEFLRKYLADQDVTEEDIAPVVAIGDPAVSSLVEAIGNVTPSQLLVTKQSDVDMVDCLARIATHGAVDGICKILRHKYRGYYGMDRMQAAAALVRLGAQDKAGVLREVIVDHKDLVARQRYSGMYHDEVAVLENALRMLEAGEGIKDTSDFGRGGGLEYGFLRSAVPSAEEATGGAPE